MFKSRTENLFSYVHVLHKTLHWEVSRRSRAVDVKEMYQKAWFTCRAVVLLIKPIVVWRCCCCKTTCAFHSTKTFENWKQWQMVQKCPGKVSRNSERCWISEMWTMHSIENSRNSRKQSSMNKKLSEKFFLKFGHPSKNKTYGCKEEQWGKGTSRVLTTEIFNSI